jgi:hypothetical protein
MAAAARPAKPFTIYHCNNKKNYAKALIKAIWYLIKVKAGCGQGWMK